jgi:hypothetical protein
MYSKQEASKIRQDFWTSFGHYMSPLLSSEGEKINWINYKTGEKNILFRMQADHRSANIAIVITHNHPGIRELYYAQLLELRKLLELEMAEPWTWAGETTDETGKTISRVYTELSPVNIFNRQDWPALISFFKPRLIALDAFWNQVKYAFDSLH